MGKMKYRIVNVMCDLIKPMCTCLLPHIFVVTVSHLIFDFNEKVPIDVAYVERLAWRFQAYMPLPACYSMVENKSAFAFSPSTETLQIDIEFGEGPPELFRPIGVECLAQEVMPSCHDLVPRQSFILGDFA